MANFCIPPQAAAKLRESLENGKIKPEEIAKMLPEEKLAMKAILEEIVSEGLGIKVSPEEIAQISKISTKIDAAQKKLGDDLGNPAKLEENLDFWKSKKEMDNYLAGKNPTPFTRIATGTAGRAAMLFSVKSPILNIGSNIEIGFAEALSRRIAGGQLRGADNGLAMSYVKMVNKVYQATGYDVSRMTSIADTISAGEHVLGEGIVHAQGPGVYRKVVRTVAEDIVFKQLMGAPDVAFSSAHFADSVNLNAMKMAKGDKALAKEIMKDSMRLEPKTPEGEVLRTQGILDAQTATWTDKTWASQTTQGLRKVFNEVSGDARLGDILFPFIKTPANVIATGLDYAGMGIPKALVESYKIVRSKDFGNKVRTQYVARNLVRAGLGLTGAVIISSQLKDEDFMGAYDPARYQIEQLRNSNYNAIRIGNKWVSTNWLGPLSVPVTSMMYARKYGEKGWKERVFQYGKGAVSSVKDLPVVNDIWEYVEAKAFKKNQSLEEMTGSTFDYLSEQVYSRLVPSFLSDIAKATDNVQRKTTAGIDRIKAKIPGLRQTLPEKRDIFGDKMKDESAAIDILFGSRVKTAKDTEITNEIDRVSRSVDKGIAFTDWDKSSGKTLGQFKEKVGQKRYDEAKIKYGQRLKERLSKLVNDGKYKKLTDEEKLDVLNGLDTIVMNSIFETYKFKYKKDEKKKLPKF